MTAKTLQVTLKDVKDVIDDDGNLVLWIQVPDSMNFKPLTSFVEASKDPVHDTPCDLGVDFALELVQKN